MEMPSRKQSIDWNSARWLTTRVPAGLMGVIDLVAQRAQREKKPIYAVGGFARDLALNLPRHDLDLVLESNAIAFGKKLLSDYGGSLDKHNRFGTAKWVLADAKATLIDALPPVNGTITPEDLPDHIDLITARSESYAMPAVLPEVTFSTLNDDLYRRDFTINAIALRLDGSQRGKLLDPFNGRQDLQDGLIRVLHPRSFIDDPTRALRAIRFEQRLGFSLEPQTEALMRDAMQYISLLTGARLRNEFNLIMAEPTMPDIMSRLAELNLLYAIHPALTWTAEHASRWTRLMDSLVGNQCPCSAATNDLTAMRTLGYTNWLYPLAEARVVEMCARMKLPSVVKASILSAKHLAGIGDQLPDMQPSKAALALDNFSQASLLFVCAMTEDLRLREVLLRYDREWRQMKPVTSGRTLLALGIPPGPLYRKILTTLREAWIDGTLETEADEVDLRDELIREHSA